MMAMIMIEFDGTDQDFHSRAWCRRRMLCGGTPEEKSLENIWWESTPAPNLGERHMNNAISSPVLACLTWKHSTTNTKKARDPFGIKNIKKKTNVEMVFSCSLVT